MEELRLNFAEAIEKTVIQIRTLHANIKVLLQEVENLKKENAELKKKIADS